MGKQNIQCTLKDRLSGEGSAIKNSDKGQGGGYVAYNIFASGLAKYCRLP